jgi:hypothetical protein
VQVESIAIRFRPRTALEAADLGGRICLDTAAATYSCYFLVAVPVIAMALASVQIAPWLPALAIWSAKPWLDRTILFVLSRAAFGQTTRPGDLWRARREVWWRQWLFMWVIGRLSPWRSVTQPVYQLEGLPIRRASARIRQIRKRNMSAGLMMGAVFSLSELTLTIALLSLVFWFAPSGRATGLMEMLFGDAGTFALVFPSAYAASVLFLEPFYVAAGFAMYLNRRADLEAWDIEQELRRAFAH